MNTKTTTTGGGGRGGVGGRGSGSGTGGTGGGANNTTNNKITEPNNNNNNNNNNNINSNSNGNTTSSKNMNNTNKIINKNNKKDGKQQQQQKQQSIDQNNQIRTTITTTTTTTPISTTTTTTTTTGNVHKSRQPIFKIDTKSNISNNINNNTNNDTNNSNNNNKNDTNRYRKNSNNHSSNNSNRTNNKNTYNNNNDFNSRKNGNSITSTLSSVPYPSYWNIEDCKRLYNITTKDTIQIQQKQQSTSTTSTTSTSIIIKNVLRGKLKVLPGNDCTSTSFISCDRGYILSDICIINHTDRNRSIHGDIVYIELLLPPSGSPVGSTPPSAPTSTNTTYSQDDTITGTTTKYTSHTMWQEDSIQMNLWNPIVPIERQMNILSLSENNHSSIPSTTTTTNDDNKDTTESESKPNQWFGRVVYVIPPTTIVPNDNKDTKMTDRSNNNDDSTSRKIIVGTIQELQQSKDKNGTIYLFNPMNRSLPQFKIIQPQLTSEHIQSYIQQAIDDDTARAKRKKRSDSHSDDDDDNDDDFDDGDNQNVVQDDDDDDDDDDWEDVEEEDDDNVVTVNKNNQKKDDKNNQETTKKININHIIFQAIYVYGSWIETYQWPPCIQLQYVGQSCTLEDEIQSLLIQYDVNHGDHNAAVVSECYNVVQSGIFYNNNNTNTTPNNSRDNNETLPTKESIQATSSSTIGNKNKKINEHDDTMNWKPTPDMYIGRKDYRNERIFTIDPTTARDLDDALHIRQISDTIIEIGVHIADVSYFVDPIITPLLDNEAKNRATTVYLVDRVIPMLPRPLCEIACSLNENVERLCFSCVWKMNIDGTIRQQKRTTTTTKNSNKENDTTTPDHIVSIDSNDVWYGRTVIKSCARLDYSTAQNIIDNPNLWTNNKNNNNQSSTTTTSSIQEEVEEEKMERLWPKSRRPVNGSIHSMGQIAADVRLMNTVAMSRRKLRFMNGALELSTTKISFQLDPIDQQTPIVASPYIIRDSNKLVEEYMLLANYLVAQRLITHCGQRACIRNHPPPLTQGLGQVKDIAKIATNCDIDISNSQSLQQSLWNVTQQLGSSSSSTTSNNNNNNNNNSNTIDNQTTLQCITQLLMTPMKPAEYIVAGYVPAAEWKHFALNIPYYTHFTSPIRRYPDIIVHRLLQESIDIENKKRQYKANKKNSKNIVDDDDCTNNSNNINSYDDEAGDVIFEEKQEVDDQVQNNAAIESVKNNNKSNSGKNNTKWDEEMIHTVCNHCNDRRMDSKAAQDRCDRIFLALFVRDKPLMGQCGIVLSVGISTCTVFIPQLGFDAKLYLQEHTNEISWTSDNVSSSNQNNGGGSTSSGIQRCIRLQKRTDNMTKDMTQQQQEVVEVNNNWTTLDIKVFTRLKVSVICKDIPPIDIKIHLEGPWV